MMVLTLILVELLFKKNGTTERILQAQQIFLMELLKLNIMHTLDLMQSEHLR